MAARGSGLTWRGAAPWLLSCAGLSAAAADRQDGFAVLFSGHSCKEKPLLEFGIAGSEVLVATDAECQQKCLVDPACEAYYFGLDSTLGSLHCATFAACSQGEENAGLTVYRRLRKDPEASWVSNCFVLLANRLDMQPFSDEAVAKMRRYFMQNLNVDDTGRSTASPGAVPADYGRSPGGYNWHRSRDSAIAMSTLLSLVGSTTGSRGQESAFFEGDVQKTLTAYASWVEKLHQSGNVTDANGKPLDVFGEPQWGIADGLPASGSLCRPESDGPPLRALVLLKFAQSQLAHDDDRQRLWDIITKDLDWVASGKGLYFESCDTWGESRDRDFFWNRVIARRALTEGGQFAAKMGDMARAIKYRQISMDAMDDPITDHLMKTTQEGVSYITQCPMSESKPQGEDCIKYQKDIDGAVILALVHSGILGKVSGKVGVAVSTVVASTIEVYNRAFCGLYPVNGADTASGKAGVLYGRYLKDQYGGGNPWVIVTAALAHVLYLAAQEVAEHAQVSEAQIAAWRNALAAPTFTGTAQEFITAGDSVLFRLRSHIADDDDYHLYEQIDKNTGAQYNAKDMTWSYAEVLSALEARALAEVMSMEHARNDNVADKAATLAPGNCFVSLPQLLHEPALGADAVAKMRKYFLHNLDVNGTGGVVASPGAVPALNDCCPGGYNYHWMRDGALSMATLHSLSDSSVGTGSGGNTDSAITQEVMHRYFKSYIRWIKAAQGRNNMPFEYMDGSSVVKGSVDAHLEPKWNMSTGLPYRQNWCRKQSDGPPLRAQGLLRILDERIDGVTQEELWKMITFDLDWVANSTIYQEDTCDLWEETTDHDFLWNRIAMRSALLKGAKAAELIGDQERARVYAHAALSHFGDPLAGHTKFNLTALGSYITECPVSGAGTGGCAQYGKDIDGAVILALVHRFRFVGSGIDETALAVNAEHLSPTSGLVARTVQVYNEAFCRMYPINQEDTKSGIPGILYGRYVKDTYGGGNPWVLITASLAALFYQAAMHVVNSGENLIENTLRAWQAALGEQFGGSYQEFIAAGDAVMLRIRHHISLEDDWHLFEQIDKNTGLQYNAKDLTWSYAEVLAALVDRERALNLPELTEHSDVITAITRDPFSTASLFIGGAVLGLIVFVTYTSISQMVAQCKKRHVQRRARKYGCLNTLGSAPLPLRKADALSEQRTWK